MSWTTVPILFADSDNARTIIDLRVASFLACSEIDTERATCCDISLMEAEMVQTISRNA
jgi:hypothetical protein